MKGVFIGILLGVGLLAAGSVQASGYWHSYYSPHYSWYLPQLYYPAYYYPQYNYSRSYSNPYSSSFVGSGIWGYSFPRGGRYY